MVSVDPCSSFEGPGDTLGILMLPARLLDPPKSEPDMDWCSVGLRRASEENTRFSESFERMESSGEKNVFTKVYSAVALSMKTIRRDRSNASTGSFYEKM
jgi:hypothetical protein